MFAMVQQGGALHFKNKLLVLLILDFRALILILWLGAYIYMFWILQNLKNEYFCLCILHIVKYPANINVNIEVCGLKFWWRGRMKILLLNIEASGVCFVMLYRALCILVMYVVFLISLSLRSAFLCSELLLLYQKGNVEIAENCASLCSSQQ
jgi:hypothetical protein